MSRKLKVYEVNSFKFGKQDRVIAAVSTQREFANLCGTSLHYIRGYASETGNDDEIAAAMAKPHTLMLSPTRLPGYIPPYMRTGNLAPDLPRKLNNRINTGDSE